MKTLAITALAFVACVVCSAAAAGQNTPTDARESFVIQPKNLKTGAKDVALRLVSNSSAGFVTSSSKQPELKFSPGVTLVAQSFKFLNSNEAECTVDVGAEAFGVIDVTMVFYSVNGTKVLSTQRSSLGVVGPISVAGSSANISVSSVELVRVNVPQKQAAGAIEISGKINGAVTITAPTGVTFAEPPKTEGAAKVDAPKLAEGSTVFQFTIANPTLEEVAVTVTGILYDASQYTTLGGQEGSLACEIGGAALSGQSALAVNAHTALTTIEGENDNDEPPPPPPAPTKKPDEPKPANTNLPSRNNPSRSESNENRNGRNNRQPSRTGNAPRTSPNNVRPGPSRRPITAPPNVRGGVPPGSAPGGPTGGPGGPGASPVSGSGNSGLAPDGTVTVEGEENSKPGETSRPGAGESDEGSSGKRDGTVEVVEAETEIEPGLYFCDKEFHPVDLVVLDKTVSGDASVRVWILLKLEKDKSPGKAGTVDVTLKILGEQRQVKLQETGPDTGEYRCSKQGILVVADKDPDSNRPEKKKIEPKPRRDSSLR